MKTEAPELYIKDFDYDLPPERIAEYPLPERDRSRLLIYQSGRILDDFFYHLDDHLPAGSLLVVNNTRVIEARILFRKPTGGEIEIFCLEPYQRSVEDALSSEGTVQWQCLIGGASKWKAGQVLHKEVEIGGTRVLLTARYIMKQADSFVIEFSWTPGHTFAGILHAAGAVPLPPYIKRKANEQDRERYQTIFARKEGSVAAPTAALHFTEQVFEKLAQKDIGVEYITLHVGAGTFQPVKSETIAGHDMHQEPFTVTLQSLKSILSAKTRIAVGTTSLRTLESLYWLGFKLIHGLPGESWTLQQWEAYELSKDYPSVSAEQSLQALIGWLEQNHQTELHCATSLIIVPGYRFRVYDGLITNFHQPRSTLLLLVSAFIGEKWKDVYQYALNNGYRFLSYGDSSLLWREP